MEDNGEQRRLHLTAVSFLLSCSAKELMTGCKRKVKRRGKLASHHAGSFMLRIYNYHLSQREIWLRVDK